MSVEVIEAAAAAAPAEPGVYFFVDDAGVVVYIGKAGDLRSRLRSHARGARNRATQRDVLRGELGAEVRWEICHDEDAASVREADLILVFQPLLNASITTEGRWVFVTTAIEHAGGRLHLSLRREATARSGSTERSYGCFAHLGVGVSSRPGIECSEGYAAFVRLLWAAHEPDGSAGFPSRIAGRSPPDDAVVSFDPSRAPALHRFLSGVGAGLVDRLAEDAFDRRPRFQHPGLRRDVDGARAFFRSGPEAIRALRLRHGVPPGPITRETIGQLLVTEVVASIGDVRVGADPDPTDGLLGRRESRHRTTRAAVRRRR